MRKIGIVSEYFYPHLGGITEHVYYFSRELIQRGFEVVLLTGYQGEKIEKYLPKGLRVISLGRSASIFANTSFANVTIGWNLGAKVKKILNDERFDLIHIHSPITPVLPLLFEKYTNTVTVGTVHTYFDSNIFYAIFHKYLQKYLDKLDGIIAVAPSCVEAMNRYFQSNYTIIPNGVDTTWFGKPAPKVEKYNDSSFNILFLGRLDPRNGLDTLLEAFPRVLKEIPQTRLVVVGDGPFRSFYQQKAGSLLGNKIFFEGQINQERPNYFATSHVFCYPATKASFGITLLESMAAGVPVVAADNIGFRDIVQDGVDGLLTRQQDATHLADTLVRVLQDSDLRQRLSTNGRKTAENYDWSKVTERVLNFYNKIYQKKKGALFAP